MIINFIEDFNSALKQQELPYTYSEVGGEDGLILGLICNHHQLGMRVLCKDLSKKEGTAIEMMKSMERSCLKESHK